jgi:hypothetical protein
MSETPKTVSGRLATPMTKLVAGGGIIVLLVAAGGFASGVSYQKGHNASANVTAAGRQFGQAGGAFGGGARRSGGRGQVTAVSASSITISDQRTGGTKTYNITSTTKITNNGAIATASDIVTGDGVFIITSSASSSDATQILVNPSMMSPGGGQSTSGPSGASI